MSNSAGAAGVAPGDRRAAEWPGPPWAPGWMVWAPPAAILVAVAYGAVRVWWAWAGAPPFGRLGFDLIGYEGWGAVGLCAAAAGAGVALRWAPWGRPLLVAAWGVCGALLVACPLLLLDVVGGLLPHSGVPFNGAAFASRAACLAEALLLGATAVAYRRRWSSACLFCGRTRWPVRAARPQRWAWWAAYAAVTGCLVRIAAQAAVGFGGRNAQSRGAWSTVEGLVFEGGFLVAGIALPLALVHSWGRRVPRGLLLVPAFAISGALTVYFGVSMVGLAAAVLRGASSLHTGSLPVVFFWVAMPAYWVWGLGLGAAAISYREVTRPECRKCGR